MARERPPAVVVFGRDGCHLCEVVESEIRSMIGTGTRVDYVDIEKDPTRQDEYLLRIPVVTIDGKEVFEAKMMDPGGNWKVFLRSLLAC